MNEEEVKIKDVLAYLRRLGIEEQDLSYEHSFSLKIGTNSVLIGAKQPHGGTIRARSDIIIRRGPVNLFVVEIKAAGHELDDDDRDQGISYARLVHPMASYVLLTNGNDWRLFNTESKDSINPENFKLSNGYRISLPDKERENALAHFLGYSSENLLLFCTSQVTEHLRPLRGSPKDLTKKYIPELTVPRTKLLAELAAFENSQQQAFLLLGESGDGKTSALCDYVQRRLAENKPTLFFSGLSLEAGLLGAISAEFGWVFSENVTAPQLVRRISDIAGANTLVVVVDAIDEWSYAQRGQSLLNFVRGCRDLPIKMVFSCRFGAWESISAPLGSDMGFKEYLFQPPREQTDEALHRLPALTNPEFSRALSKYRKVFKIRSWFEDKALDEARTNPFMLRVMFVVAAEYGKDVTFSSLEFFEKYWELTLRRSGQYDAVRTQLMTAAKLMYERNTPTISDPELRVALNLPGSAQISSALLEQNLLARSGDGYRFYFQLLRDFLIAIKIRKWNAAPVAELKQVSPDGVQGDAMALYLRYGSETQLSELLAPRWENAVKYLELFRAIVTECFPNLIRELVPGEGDEIGFLGEYVVRDNSIGGYGFRLRSKDQPSIFLLPVDKFFSQSNLLSMAGAHSIHHCDSANGFFALDIPREVVEHEILPGIEKIIKERRLSLRGRRVLAEERLVATVYNGRNLFDEFIDSYRGHVTFPISVEKVREIILREKLYRHFEHELIEEKLDNGSIRERYFKDGSSTYDRTLSIDEKSQIRERVKIAIQAREQPSMSTISSDLRDIEELLARSGVFDDLGEVPKSPWSTAFGMSVPNLYNHYPTFAEQWDESRKLVTEHLRKFFQEFFDGYQTVVDANFGALSMAFPLRAKLPIRYYFNFSPRMGDRHHEISGSLLSTIVPLEKGMQNEVVACADGELTTKPAEGIFYKGSFLSDSYSMGGVQKEMYWLGNTPLTDRIYSKIEQEWPKVANELRKRYGVRIKDIW